MKIYLAGQMTNLTFNEMNGWRKKIQEYFKNYKDITVINPVDFYNFDKVDKMKATPREVKEYDLWLVKNSDIILVNLDHPDSIGTAIELHMAHDVWGIPVIGFGNTKNHDWIECSLLRRCETMREALVYIESFYYPIQK
jgi:nucleoside 2-deoxyribosyltransferase